MSELRALLLHEVVQAAGRVLADPPRNAVRVSQNEVVSLAALCLQQHDMITAAGLAYPTRPRPPATLPPPLFGPLGRERTNP